jgi:hypothetical protein
MRRTYFSSSASCARVSSSQKIAREPVAACREMPSRTQSSIAAFFVVAERQMSPASTSWECSTSPEAST